MQTRTSAQAPVHQPGFNSEAGVGVTEAPNYRRWEIDAVAEHCGRSVLEIGSGMGHFSSRLLDLDIDRLVLSDTAPACLELLHEKYDGVPKVDVITLTLPGPVDTGEPVDTVVAMNVLEHIDDDAGAIRDLAAKLKPGGKMIIWVPAYMALYGEFDRKIGHFRRYTPTTIRTAVENGGMQVESARPINLLGGIGWWIAVRRGGAGQPDPRLVWLFDKIAVPVTRLFERIVRPPFGQSVLCVARKPTP